MSAPQRYSDKDTFVAPFLLPQSRRPARTPLPTARQLSEQRRNRFFNRIQDDRQDSRFERRADDMMQSTYKQEQQVWMSEMERAARDLPDQEEEVVSDDSPAFGLEDIAMPEVPPEIEDPEQLDADDLAAISLFDNEALPSDHFEGDDDTDEFRELLNRVAEQYERATQMQISSQGSVDGMNTLAVNSQWHDSRLTTPAAGSQWHAGRLDTPTAGSQGQGDRMDTT